VLKITAGSPTQLHIPLTVHFECLPSHSVPAINRHVPIQHLSLLTKPRIHIIQKRMKGFPNYLVALALVALACSIASAYDPTPLQDFCVAVKSSTDAGICAFSFFFFLIVFFLSLGSAYQCNYARRDYSLNMYGSCDTNELFCVQYL
jgi:hypothetical protein